MMSVVAQMVFLDSSTSESGRRLVLIAEDSANLLQALPEHTSGLLNSPRGCVFEAAAGASVSRGRGGRGHAALCHGRLLHGGLPRPRGPREPCARRDGFGADDFSAAA